MTRRTVFGTCLSALSLFSLASLPLKAAAVWPIPAQLSTGNSSLRLSSSFSINASFDAPTDLAEAINRTQTYLFSDKLAPLVVDRGASLAEACASSAELTSLVLQLSGDASSGDVTPISNETIKALDERDESYTLTVPEDGSAATIQANTTLGLLRGLTTFEQLWYTVGEQVFTYFVPVQINDTPAFVSFCRL